MSVLVLDASGNHALAVVRSLGARGIDVVAADSVPFAQGSFSRFCSRRALYPSPKLGVRPFQQSLLSLLDALRPEVLLPMTECTLQAIAPIREEVGARTRLAPLPAPGALATAFDKEATVSLARSLGVRVPRSASLRDLDELPALRASLSYPAVIKPRSPERVSSDGRVCTGGPVVYCDRAEDLETRYLSVHRRAPFPLIQEFIPGEGFGVSALYDHGRLRAMFAHRRLRMVQPTGSGSSLRESIAPPPDMADAAQRLLEALQWHGVAMVEFKRDARDGSAVMMEINGRFWNSLPLAVASGVDFPFLLYTLATRGECPERLDYRVGVKGRWLAGDVQHLVEVMRGRPAGWSGPYPSRLRSLLGFLRFGGKDLHYDDLWLSDPVPFLMGLVGGALRKMPKLAPRRPRVGAAQPRHEETGA